jgi:hypothetical protein
MKVGCVAEVSEEHTTSIIRVEELIGEMCSSETSATQLPRGEITQKRDQHIKDYGLKCNLFVRKESWPTFKINHLNAAVTNENLFR